MFGDFDLPDHFNLPAYFDSEEQDFYPQGDPQDDLPLGDGRTDTSAWGVRRDPLKLSRAAQERLVAQGQRPTPGKPNIWQRIAAIGAGAAGGYINAAGRTRVDSDGAVRAIYEGDTPRRQAEWEAENERLRQAAGMEQTDNARRVQEYNAQTAAEMAAARQGLVGEAARLRQLRAESEAERLRLQREHNAAVLAAQENRPQTVRPGERLVNPKTKETIAEGAKPQPKATTLEGMIMEGVHEDHPARVEAQKKRNAELARLNRVGTGAGRATPKPTQQQVLDTLTMKVVDDAVKGGASSWDHVKQNLQKFYKNDPRFTPEKRRKILAELEAQVQAGIEFPTKASAGLPPVSPIEGGGEQPQVGGMFNGSRIKSVTRID